MWAKVMGIKMSSLNSEMEKGISKVTAPSIPVNACVGSCDAQAFTCVSGMSEHKQEDTSKIDHYFDLYLCTVPLQRAYHKLNSYSLQTLRHMINVGVPLYVASKVSFKCCANRPQ